ncbi:AAA family ATPase, partial [Patescibacteria group bacterium]|nr:AAA family ATPase [Patescibacteria group bacterium]
MKGRYRNIIVCGDVGTGTTTLSKELAKKLGWRHISAGNFFRKYFKKHNIPLWDKLSVPDKVEEVIRSIYEM